MSAEWLLVRFDVENNITVVMMLSVSYVLSVVHIIYNIIMNICV